MSNQLSLLKAIPLGIGSIIGSGILFLPSLTYKVSENDVLLSWSLIIFFCLIGITYLKRLLFQSKVSERNVAGMIKVGLGETIGNSVYVLLLGTVVIGMPSAAIIAGDYLQQVFNLSYLKEIASVLIISIAILANIKGTQSSAIVASIITVALTIISVIFIILTTGLPQQLNNTIPSFNILKTYQGAVLAFWAFAGFENLTFLYDKFKNPKRDFLPTIVISIVVCGALYMLLVYNYASAI